MLLLPVRVIVSERYGLIIPGLSYFAQSDFLALDLQIPANEKVKKWATTVASEFEWTEVV